MKILNSIPFFVLLLSLAITGVKAQKIPADYHWGPIDRQKILNSRDSGFISLAASNGNYQPHTVVKINSGGELVYRFEANPEKMFKHFIKDATTYYDRDIVELSNGNVVVWFSASKDNRCPVELYYYILNPKGELLQAAAVPFDKKYKSISNPKLQNMVMVNDAEAILSVEHGPSCKDIFKNSSMNKSVLFNLSTGDIRPLPELDGFEVINCVAEKGYVYLLVLPLRFYRNDAGVKDYREVRQYQLWKLNSVYEKQASQAYYDLYSGAIIPRMELDATGLRLFYCRQMYNEVEFGFKVMDKETLLQRRVKVYTSKLFEQNAYAVSDDYFLYGSTIISDATGDNMILFSLEPWKHPNKSSLNVYAAVVMDGVLRSGTKILATDQIYSFAVSQVNSQGKYLLSAPASTSLTFMGDLEDHPLPEFYENEKAVASLKEKLLKESIVAPGTQVVLNDIATDDQYFGSKSGLVGNTFKAGRYLLRYGNGSYTGYLMDANNKELFFYNIKLAYPKK
jgi:hypothetical protein